VELPLVVLSGLSPELRLRLRGTLEAAGFRVREREGSVPKETPVESRDGSDMLLLAPVTQHESSSSGSNPTSEALAHLPPPPYGVAPNPAPDETDEATAGKRRTNLLKRALEAPERAVLAWALRQTGGNREKAARLLGLHRATLVAKLRKHGLRNGNIEVGPHA